MLEDVKILALEGKWEAWNRTWGGEEEQWTENNLGDEQLRLKAVKLEAGGRITRPWWRRLKNSQGTWRNSNLNPHLSIVDYLASSAGSVQIPFLLIHSSSVMVPFMPCTFQIAVLVMGDCKTVCLVCSLWAISGRNNRRIRFYSPYFASRSHNCRHFSPLLDLLMIFSSFSSLLSPSFWRPRIHVLSFDR